MEIRLQSKTGLVALCIVGLSAIQLAVVASPGEDKLQVRDSVRTQIALNNQDATSSSADVTKKSLLVLQQSINGTTGGARIAFRTFSISFQAPISQDAKTVELTGLNGLSESTTMSVGIKPVWWHFSSDSTRLDSVKIRYYVYSCLKDSLEALRSKGNAITTKVIESILTLSESEAQQKSSFGRLLPLVTDNVERLANDSELISVLADAGLKAEVQKLTTLPRLYDRALRVRPLVSSLTFSAGYQKYEYLLRDTTAVRADSVDHYNFSFEGSVGLIVNRLYLGTFGRVESLYKAAKTKDFVLQDPSNSQLSTIMNLEENRPKKQTNWVMGLEGRLLAGSSLGTKSQLSWSPQTGTWAVESWFYFLTDKDKGSLNGGVLIAYDSEKKELDAGLFISKDFLNLFP